MQKSADFLGGIAKQGAEKVKSGLSGFSKFAFGALAVAALAFLNSPKFEEIKNTILDVIIPAAAYLYDNVIKPLALYIGGKLKNLFLDLKAYVDGDKGIGSVIFDNIGIIAGIVTMLAPNLVFGALKVAAKTMVTAIKFLAGKGGFGAITGIFASLKAFFRGTIIPAVTTGLIAIKTFFIATLMPFLAAAAVPIALVTAAAAAIALALYSLKEGFDSFMFELEATGSVWEAIKSGIVTTISTLLGFPLDLLKDGLSFIIGKIGSIFGIESFTKASEAMDDFSFIDMFKDGLTFIGDAFAGLIDKIKNLAENMIRKIPVFGGKLADKIFGTKEEQAAAKKEAEEEQKRFEEQRKALREQKKLEKQAEEAKKLEAAKKKQEAEQLKVLEVSKTPAVAKTEAISRRADDPRQYRGGAPIAVNAPTSVNNSPTTNVTQNNRSLSPTDRAMDQIALAF